MNESEEPESFDKAEFQLEESKIDEIYSLVSQQFQILDYYMEHGTLTFHIQTDQNSKEAFLKLYRKLKPIGLLPVLRQEGEREILRVIEKPPAKKSNIKTNLALFLVTLVTTFFTGYLISRSYGWLDPIFGGLTFMITIMAIVGIHEMGHKIAAWKYEVDATFPYFIPGPPPPYGIGTFGAVIMQKSPPPNRDSLFDIGASGPFAGFIMSLIITIVGLILSPSIFGLPKGPFMPLPILFVFIARLLGLVGVEKPGNLIILHPIAFSGIIGMIVTMLNLLPVGTLDGGHIARSITKGKGRTLLVILSILFVLLTGFYWLIIIILFIALYKHPGPLDDISSLSRGRKLLIPVILAILILCGVMVRTPSHELRISSQPLIHVPFKIYYADSKYYSNQTEWAGILAEGVYVISVPTNFSCNGQMYIFLHWNDGDTNSTKTIFLCRNIALIAFYKAVTNSSSTFYK